MKPPFESLFQPIKIGHRESRNRIMRLATSTNSGDDGIATDNTVALHRRAARGGAGVIVTESMRVHRSNRGRDFSFVLYEKDVIPSLARVADAVHEEGALFIAQINHGGRQHHANEHPTLWAPSAIACPHSGGVPHAMSKAEIKEVVDGFVKAAVNAKIAGCAGVEIHGAQGHLIQEFLSPLSNKRTDEYGGNLLNRSRFATEIVAAVRDKVGSDFIVGYRMGVHEFWPGALDLTDTMEAAQHLNGLGAIDYFSLAQGNFNTLDMHLPDSHYKAPAFIDIQSQFKPVLGNTPVVASARINTPEAANAIVSSGQADMVGMCRALIADPEWPGKVQRGELQEIRRCIGCNRCWAWILEGKPLRCAINATVGQELKVVAKPRRKKRVVVIGGGPGGLETARASAESGHDVILFESMDLLGGKLALARQYLPYHESSYAIDYLVHQIAKLGVDVRLSTAATASIVALERPDAVVVATGATAYAPALAGDNSVPVTTESRLGAGASIVLMDEDANYWAACVVEALALRGCKVTYVTRFLEPLRELPEITRISTLRSLDKLGVRVVANMFVDRCVKGGVELRHYYNTDRTERIEAVDEVVWIGPQSANTGIVDELAQAGIQNVQLIGDAYAPRRLPNAIHEGYKAAATISECS